MRYKPTIRRFPCWNGMMDIPSCRFQIADDVPISADTLPSFRHTPRESVVEEFDRLIAKAQVPDWKRSDRPREAFPPNPFPELDVKRSPLDTWLFIRAVHGEK